MATRKPKENDASLPFAALQLLAPPVRLVSAAIWKVMKQRDVMQYGVVEEFVTSACETVPGLLTVRHQGKLVLGLRGRLILELCCKQPDEKVIKPHLERLRAPTALSTPSAPTVKRDVKILKTVESLHSLVHTLLTDPAEREYFFKEEFPVDYGPTFDLELEKLLWEFLIRVDQLLPVPSLAQTVSWLSNAPAVLEECAHAATQPQLLKTLLEHQTCLGHLEAAASLPPNMGDSILASLSLPPSGRVRSNQSTGTKNPAADQSHSTQAKGETSFVTPVIGLISNEEVPFMISAKKRTQRGEDASKENSKFTLVKPRQTPKDVRVKDDGKQGEEEGKASKRSSGMKRKQADGSESDEEEEVLGIIRSARKRTSQGRRSGASSLTQGRDHQGRSENKDVGAKTKIDMCNRAALESRMTQLGIKALRLPEDPSLCSIFLSCLSSQPKVVLQKLAVTAASANRTGSGGKSFYSKQQKRRRRSPVKAPSRSNLPQKPDLDYTGLDDKENHPVSPSISSSPAHQRTNTETAALPGESEDYVADSEDEATKNFKGRLFMKRYYKTKHGTYVPTLREYFKPGMARRDLSAAGIKRR